MSKQLLISLAGIALAIIGAALCIHKVELIGYPCLLAACLCLVD